MVKTYQNTIENSPIKQVIISNNTIKLYGEQASDNEEIVPKKFLAFTDIQKLKRFLNFLSNEKNIHTAISQEIVDAINHFHPKHNIHQKASLLYSQMEQSIQEASKKAGETGKKLLILMGEEHCSWDSFLLDLLALDICKKNNITNFFAESSELILRLKTPINQPYFWALYENENHYPILERAALKNDMALHLVDPLCWDAATYKTTWKTRENKINEAISSANVAGIFCVGYAHLWHINSALSSQYEIITFNTGYSGFSNSELYQTPLLTRAELEARQQEMLSSYQNAIHENDAYYDFGNFVKSYEECTEQVDSYDIQNLYSTTKVIDLSIATKSGYTTLESYSKVLDIANDIISEHNPGSPTLETLKTIRLFTDQLQNIYLTSPSHKRECETQYQELTDSLPPEDSEQEVDNLPKLPAEEFQYFLANLAGVTDTINSSFPDGYNIINYE